MFHTVDTMKNKVRVRKGAQGIVTFTSIPPYPSAGKAQLLLQGSPVLLTTTVTTGIIAYEGQISPPTIVNNFAGRFGATFDEYRVLRAHIEMHAVGIYTGQTAFFLSEVALGTPIFNEAQERTSKLLNNNNQVFKQSTNVLKWVARDTSDLAWQSIGTNYNGVHYYVYTDNANYGAPTTVTQLWIVRPRVLVEFRGLKS